MRERLEAVEIEGAAAARERAWSAVETAHASRRRPRRRLHRRAGGLGVALALLVAAVAAASSSPGVAVREWVVRALGGIAAPAPRTALGPLPDGRMLVTSPRGVWTVGPDGARRLLGRYDGASWSPRGLFVIAWRGDVLRAVAPDGRVAWTLRTIARGRRCALVARRLPRRLPPRGRDRRRRRRRDGRAGAGGEVRPAAPAWRPGAAHSLAWVGGDGRVVLRDVDTGRLEWLGPRPLGAARELLWSADGLALLIRGAGGLQLADFTSGRVSRVRMARGERAVAAAWAPRGRRVAVVVRRGATVSRVLMLRAGAAPRELFATTGRLSGPVWSPGGGRVLVRWSEADEWLLLPVSGRGRVTAIAPVARRFGGTPTVRGWCCTK